ncbi:MAG: hypothetical protein NTU62_00385 [Spirochaetes bacterium]|nr:hypothetical protein [Spirochaetota bacterium]
MNHVERFRATMGFQPVDRLPRWEWAMWWDLTVENWKSQGLPRDRNTVYEVAEYFGLDPFQQFWFSPLDPTIEAVKQRVGGKVATMDDYLRIRPMLYPDHAKMVEDMRSWARRQERGEVVVWATLEGFFWFPRTLMGVEAEIYAFFDQPELIHRINSDLCDFNLRVLDQMEPVCVPTFMTIAEDMSYNHGPMLSKALFDEFLAPYYRRLVPRLYERGVIVIVDTDGDVTRMVPWLEEVGVQGVAPLERQAGVDGMRIRKAHPRALMIGHFDKMVMNKGEAAIRAEFERLMPLMRSGGFIPSVDHQTPPHVTMEEYRLYRRLLDEYTEAAAR